MTWDRITVPLEGGRSLEKGKLPGRKCAGQARRVRGIDSRFQVSGEFDDGKEGILDRFPPADRALPRSLESLPLSKLESALPASGGHDNEGSILPAERLPNMLEMIVHFPFRNAHLL